MGKKLPWILGAGAAGGGLAAGFMLGKKVGKATGAKAAQAKAAAAGHAASPKQKRDTPTSSKPVVIVGGGNAGLAAAYELEKAGVDYVLYEASDRLGGRVGLVHVGEYEYATGAGFTEPQWKKTFEYLNEFGMMDKVHRIDRQVYGFWYEGKVHYIPLGGGKDDMQQMLAFRGLPARIVPQLLRFLPQFLKYTRGIDENHDFSSLAELSAMSTAEFGRKYGGEDVVDRILTPFLGTMVLTTAEQVSIAHPIALMSLMQGMCSIDGGLSSINDEIIKRVGHKCKLNTPVKKVVIENANVKGIELESGFVEADQVVLAVDAETALAIAPDLPPAIADPLGTCKYSASWNYIIGCEKGVTPEDFFAVFIPGSEDSILTTIFDENGALKNNPEGTSVLHAFTAGWHDDELGAMTQEERDRAVIKEVQKFFPDVPDEPAFVHSIRYDRAVNLEKPGQYVAIQDLLKHHFNDVRGLHLAGEYLFLIACTEGAWSTGADAGQAVVDELWY